MAADKKEKNQKEKKQKEKSVEEKENITNEQDTDEFTENIKKLEQEIFEYRDKLVRKAAEFENYKKRTAEEFSRLIQNAGEGLIIKLLPVLDDFERLINNCKDDQKVSDLKKGVEMIHEKFKSTLRSTGLKEIEAVNQEFDPELHEALMLVEKEDTEPDIIVDEHEKGYMLNDKVIRHSKVLVSK